LELDDAIEDLGFLDFDFEKEEISGIRSKIRKCRKCCEKCVFLSKCF